MKKNENEQGFIILHKICGCSNYSFMYNKHTQHSKHSPFRTLLRLTDFKTMYELSQSSTTHSHM